MNRKFWIIALVIGFLALLFESAGAFGRIGEKAILGGITIGLLTFFVFIYAYATAWRKRADKPKAAGVEKARRATQGHKPGNLRSADGAQKELTGLMTNVK